MIGRQNEIKELNKLYNSGQAELVAVYGRRRVGKTFLVDETFSGRITFRHAGLSGAEMDSQGLLKAQLDHFYNSLILHGMQETRKPDNWLDAFLLLELFLQKIDHGERQLVFIDELPWLDTPRSGFLTAFEGFWNTWACHRKNLMVIVCGSANSWILDRLINNHGGLYGRVTHEIKLSPFNLKECEELYREKQVKYSRYDIVQSYMIFGGIPYYLNYIDGSVSLAQNIDKLFFSKNGVLKLEFDRLFDSVFVNPETIKTIVKLLYTRNAGYTRNEIIELLNIKDGGSLTRNLNALLASDFITKYVPFGYNKKQEHYKLTDPFCLFYLHFVRNQKENNTLYWQQNTNSQPVVSWRGFAFENVCFNHIAQIKKALGISGVITSESAWSKRDHDDDNTQIDMLIVRNDNIVNMCEMKFYSEEFTVTKDYYRRLLKREGTLVNSISKKQAVMSTLITTFGLTANEYSGFFQNVLTMDDLFE